MTAPAPDSLRFRAEVPERVRSGEPVPVTLRLRNTSRQPVDLYLTGRPIAFDVVVSRDGGEVVWRRLEGEVVSMVLQIRRLEPDEALELRATWNQRTNAGEHVGPGVYAIHAVLPTDQPLPLTTPPVSLTILRP